MRVTMKDIGEIAARHGFKVARVNGNQGKYLWFTAGAAGVNWSSFTIPAQRLTDRTIEEWEKVIAEKVRRPTPRAADSPPASH